MTTFHDENPFLDLTAHVVERKQLARSNHRLARCLSFVVFAFVASFASPCTAAERPNFVWIVSEDNSIHYLRHWFPGGAEAPRIESLAAQGLTFDHAFSNAPVCSVARTTLITGCFAPRIGTQFHRRYRLAPMPHGLRMFPAYLRDAGYYTTNNRKKDYNANEGPGVWDVSSADATWRARPVENQPFFHMQSHSQSHEGRLHFSRHAIRDEPTATDPRSIQLASYHPDTKLFRYTHARYHDRMRMIDEIVGDTIDQLAADGLLEDTFVFYFGDHGGVLPRSKGYVYESGLHVPLVIRVPKNFKHLVNFRSGSRIKGFVSFVDFAPTILNLAGLSAPEQMDGRAFLGSDVSTADVNGRDEMFGYADRFDEKYDLVRTLRKGKYQYVRNYQSYLPDGLNNNYRYKSLAYQQWRDLYNDKKLVGAERQFFEPRSAELLFDCEADPHQVNDLADDPRFANELMLLRQRLQQLVKQLPDLSFYPESYLVQSAMENPVQFGHAHQAEIARLVDVADLALHPFAEVEERLRKAWQSDDRWIRYWAATVSSAFGQQAKGLTAAARPRLDDECWSVRIRTAEFLGRIGAINPQPILTKIVNTTDDAVLATEALNSVVWFRDFFDNRYPVSRSDFRPTSLGADIEDRLNYINGEPYPPSVAP